MHNLGLLFFIIPDTLQAQQPTYSHRYAVDSSYAASVYTNGLQLGDTIYTTGVHAELLGEDTVVRRDFSSLVMHDAQTGEIIGITELPNPPGRLFDAWIDDMIYLQDTIYIFGYLDAGTVLGMYKMSRNGGIYQFIDSIVEGFMFRPNLQLLNDSSFLLSYQIRDNEREGIAISKFSRNGTKLFSWSYFTENGARNAVNQVS